MENLTYEAYRSNPEVREQIDAEVQRLRQEAIHQYIVVPVASAWKRVAGNLRAKQFRPAPKSA